MSFSAKILSLAFISLTIGFDIPKIFDFRASIVASFSVFIYR